jgi:oxalate decarboxylase
MTVYASGSDAGTFDYQPGDVAYVPRNMPHYNENTGMTLLRSGNGWRSRRLKSCKHI